MDDSKSFHKFSKQNGSCEPTLRVSHLLTQVITKLSKMEAFKALSTKRINVYHNKGHFSLKREANSDACDCR